MINLLKLLKKIRWRLCLVLCLYFVSVLAQPWTHSHLNDALSLLHVHVSENYQHDEHGNDANHFKDHDYKNTFQGYIKEFPIQSTAIHLLLDSFSSIVYLPIQSKYGKVPISYPAFTLDLVQKDSDTIVIAVKITIENPPRLSSIIITALTDLSPPRA